MNVAMVPRDCTGQMQVFCNPGTSDVQGGSVLDMLHQSCNDDEDHDVVEGEKVSDQAHGFVVSRTNTTSRLGNP